MRLSKILVEYLIRLSKGKSISYSLKNEFLTELLHKGILKHVKRGCHNSLYATEPENFREYLANNYEKLQDLERLLLFFEDVDKASSQADISWIQPQNVEDKSNGIYISSNQKIKAKINGEKYIIQPHNYIETYIRDCQELKVDKEASIVYVKNLEVFKNIHKIYKIFDNSKLAFVYSENFDNIINIVKNNKNNYIHFGNFDFNEIEFFESKIYSEIGERGVLFIPKVIKECIKKGSLLQFKEQYKIFRNSKLKDLRIKPLRELLIQHQRAFNQIGFLDNLK